MTDDRPSVIEAARRYIARGFQPIPIAPRSKAPARARWSESRIDADDVPLLFTEESNIGLLLGEPSGCLVDVDLDDPDARDRADEFLPPTGAVSGRASSPRSHRWYVCRGAPFRRYFDPVTRKPIVEVRSTGAQTLVWPSVHPSGEVYEPFDGAPEIVGADELLRAVADLAGAVCAARHGPDWNAAPQWRATGDPPPANGAMTPADDAAVVDRAVKYLERLDPAISGAGGHNQTLWAARCLVRGFGLDPGVALELLERHYNPRCQPPWSSKELLHKVSEAYHKPFGKPYGWLRDAGGDRSGKQPENNRQTSGNVDLSGLLRSLDPSAPPAGREAGDEEDDEEDGTRGPDPPSAAELVARHPRLRRPIINGLLREGETMNVIAAPKVGKSWLTLDLALSVAVGRPWLGVYSTRKGDVLILDNELHPETSAWRVPQVAQARGVPPEEYGRSVFIENLRGRLVDVFGMAPYFEAIEPGRYKIIVLDAFYRFMAHGMDENDNAGMAAVYNQIDRYAERLGCAFVLIHHTSKGVQGNKSVTDVGAGAGAQSRAADAHLVLRPHEEDGVIVLDAAARSWPPIDPVCLRWDFPVWTPAEGLDPTALKSEKGGKRDNKPQHTPTSFVEAFVRTEPATRSTIIERAVKAGLSQWRADQLLRTADSDGLMVREGSGGRNKPYTYRLGDPSKGEEGTS